MKRKLSFSKFSKGSNNCANELTHSQTKPKSPYFHKERKTSALPLDVEEEFRPNDVLGDSCPEMVSGAEVQIPVASHKGREMSAPRPCLTDVFHPLSTVSNIKSLLFFSIISKCNGYFFQLVRQSVSTIAHALFENLAQC